MANRFDPRAFQAFFEKDPSKQGKMDPRDAIMRAQYAAKMAHISRMLNPSRF
jgi:hypothetical protein